MLQNHRKLGNKFLFVVAVLAITGIVSATYDKHDHTADGTITTDLNVTVAAVHTLQVIPPPGGGARIDARIDSLGTQVWSCVGLTGHDQCKRCYRKLYVVNNTTYDFQSVTSHHSGGHGAAWIADSGNVLLPTCNFN